MPSRIDALPRVEALTRMGATVGEFAYEPQGLATWSTTGD